MNTATVQKIHRIERTQWIEQPLNVVFDFFSNAANLQSITPSFLRFRIVTPPPVIMRLGARIDYKLSLFNVPLRWRTHITEWQPGLRFVDEQESGPYAFWRHVHEFEARGDSTLMHDTVRYAAPFGVLGRMAHVLFVARTLERIFDYRRDSIRSLLDAPNTRHQ